MHRLKSALVALAVGIVLVATLDFVASAATGRPMILGFGNKAGRTTVVKNIGKGPAVKFKSRKGASIAVNSKAKVKKLNADLLDGRDSSSFKTNRSTVVEWAVPQHTGGFTRNLAPVSPGTYLATYSVHFAGASGTPGNPTSANCYLRTAVRVGTQVVNKRIVANTSLSNVGDVPPALSGAGVLQISEGDIVGIVCGMSPSKNWRSGKLQPVQVTLTRTDGRDLQIIPFGTSP